MESKAEVDESNYIGDRIRMVRAGKSLTGFASGFGIHKNTLSRYEKGDGLPDAAFLTKLCDVYKISPDWILTGTGNMYKSRTEPLLRDLAAPTDAQGLDPDIYACIPLYDMAASGGDGTFVGEEGVIDSLAFKREWIRSELRANPGDLVLVMMSGESMAPTLGKDDILLVDSAPGKARSDGIYLSRSTDVLLVKRLQFLPDGNIRVISDNPAYEPFTVYPAESDIDFKIIGRVVWAGRKF